MRGLGAQYQHHDAWGKTALLFEDHAAKSQCCPGEALYKSIDCRRVQIKINGCSLCWSPEAELRWRSADKTMFRTIQIDLAEDRPLYEPIRSGLYELSLVAIYA